MSTRVFRWVRGCLYCSECDTREGVALDRVHDRALVHHRWWHGRVDLNPTATRQACCSRSFSLRGLEHNRECPNWVLCP